MSATLPIHQRTLIRLAMVELLKGSPALASLVGKNVFSNRYDAWSCHDMPGIGVYTVSDKPVPDSNDRTLFLNVEAVTQGGPDLDALLEAISLQVEKAVSLDALGGKMMALGGQDTLISWELGDVQLDLAADDAFEYAVLTMVYSIVYQMPVAAPDLPAFDVAGTRWNLTMDDPENNSADDVTAINPDAEPLPPQEAENWGDNGQSWPQPRPVSK
ncbi:hypothetical protein LJC48_01175 [Desulfovibrio sp. OttesenSCG-928-C06]|nr:hypothetical protein [Desulfovibrio sp. OttesenSCG-928-C06]